MKYSLRKPCADCPFRSDKPPLLMNARVQEMVTAILEDSLTFTCHKTNCYDEQGEAADTDDVQFCAGAMILLARLGKRHDALDRARQQGAYEPARLDLTAPVYANKEEMFAAAGSHFLRAGPELI